MVVTKDKMIAISYTLKGDDGNTIDTSVGGEPLAYLHGQGYLLPKLEEALEGKAVGDKVSVVLEPKDGYGEYDEKLVVEVPKSQFDTSVPIEVGMQFQANTPAGPQIVTVTEVTDTGVKINANHELAGKTLHFDVEIVDIHEPTEEDLKKLSGGCNCGGDCDGECGDDCGCDGGCNGGCGGN